MQKISAIVMDVILKNARGENKMKINNNTKISDLIESNPDAIKILFEEGLGCIGCSMAMHETIEQGCLAHGMEKEDIKNLIKRLNKK